MNTSVLHKGLLVFLLALFAILASAWIVRASVPIGSERYFYLFDDAMVSMRYAKNLAAGEGLVWNAGGERVEGITNPLWTFVMAGVHAAGIPRTHTSLVVQVISVVLMMGALVVVYRITRSLEPEGYAAHIAVGCSAFYLPFQYWGLHGTEVSLQVLVVLLVFAVFLRMRNGEPLTGTAMVLLAAAPWIRLDAVVPCFALLGGLALADRRLIRPAVQGAAVLVGSVLIQTALRWVYFGELLPNTYYLKLGQVPFDLRLAEGLRSAWAFIVSISPAVLIVALAAPWITRSRILAVPVAVLASQIGYTIYTGGDSWEYLGGSNRFIAAQMPLFFMLLAIGGRRLFALAAPVRTDASHAFRWGRAAIAGVVLAALFWTVHSRTLWWEGDYMMLRSFPFNIVEHREHVRKAVALKQAVTPEATVAVVWAGIVPYYLDNTCVDILGKSDPHVARLGLRPAPPGVTPAYEPGHEKIDYAHSIGTMRPDVVVELWRRRDDAFAAMGNDYLRGKVEQQSFYFRKGSPHIHWDVVEDLQPVVDADLGQTGSARDLPQQPAHE